MKRRNFLKNLMMIGGAVIAAPKIICEHLESIPTTIKVHRNTYAELIDLINRSPNWRAYKAGDWDNPIDIPAPKFKITYPDEPTA